MGRKTDLKQFFLQIEFKKTRPDKYKNFQTANKMVQCEKIFSQLIAYQSQTVQLGISFYHKLLWMFLSSHSLSGHLQRVRARVGSKMTFNLYILARKHVKLLSPKLRKKTNMIRSDDLVQFVWISRTNLFG